MFLLLISLLATQILDFEMTPEEKKKTGIYKLSEKQKASLQQWIDNHYEKRSEPLQKTGPKTHPVLSETLQNGHFIRLSDNSLWRIDPHDTPLTQSWVTPVEIIITETKEGAYPYKLTNSLTGTTVRAQKAERSDLKAAPTQPVPAKTP